MVPVSFRSPPPLLGALVRAAGLVLAVALLASVSTSCSGGRRDDEGPTRTAVRPADPEETRVVAALETLTRAIEAENTFEFMEGVSDRYSPSPFTLKTAADAMLLDHLGYTFQIRPVRFFREDAVAVLAIEWRYGRSHRQTGLISWENGYGEFRFEREDGRWKLAAQTGDPLFEAPSPF